LQTLVLTKNRLTELADLDPLVGFKKLVFLVVMGNPVAVKEVRTLAICDTTSHCGAHGRRMVLTRTQNYRYWVIWRCPTVRYLDFAKVKDVEREKARELFGTPEEPTELASKIMGVKSKGFVVPTTNGAADTHAKERIYTDDEKRRMRAAIQAASSLAEMARLEKDFAEGRIPAHILEGGDVMET
jgi:hypothetical protein